MKKFSKILLIFLSIFLIAFATGVIAQDDNIPPVVTEFDVDSGNPTDSHVANIDYPDFTISWTVTDEGGSHLSHVEVWRTVDLDGAPDPDQWTKIGPDHSAPADSDSWSNSATESPSDGIYWYGLHVLDNDGNIGYESDPPGPIKVTVDKTLPIGTIEAVPDEVRADETFNITVSGEDNIEMGIVCYKEENDINWTCYNCPADSTCNYAFERSESALGKYKYYGYVADFVENGNFTDPEYVEVIVETDPLVATFSVSLQATQATLNGYLIYMGGAETVEVWFEWGTTTDYGNETEHVSKDTTGSFNDTITGLIPGVVYHFRAVVKNGVGTAYGEDLVTTELIKNGGFETGDLNGWSETTWGYYKADTEDVYKGAYSGLFGFKEGFNKPNGKSALYQDLSIPSAATDVELSFSYKFYTTDRCDYDFINIYLKDTANNILKTYLEWCCQDCSGLNTYGWNREIEDLTNFAGQTIRIWFEVENRSDPWHRSWAYIDEVSIKYTPILLPSITTKPATSIETNQAVLNGELTDMGKANLVEVWFVWDFVSHSNWQDYLNQTELISLTSVGPFSTLLGNLNSGTTYHYRAIARNNTGTSSGEDLQFTTAYSTAGGWISPSGHEDPEGKWVDEPKAYDAPYAPNYLETYASNSKAAPCRPVGSGLDGFIVFTLPHAVRSNKIRVNADYLDIHINYVDIDVLREGSWIDVHQGPIANCAWHEIPFAEGMVTKARFRYNYKVSNWCYWIYEFQFYKVPDEPITPPAGITLEATSIEENSAILHGQVIDDGRELCQIRFQYGRTTDYGVNTLWEGSWASGETFGKFISGLDNNATYHFRAQIKNSAGIASGADKTFFTQSAASGWVSPQGFSDPSGKWEDEGYTYDDEIGTYAKSYRYSGDGVWSPYFYLTRAEIVSDKIRFWARELVEVDLVVIDVYRNGSWTNVYNGTFPDYQWVEASFSSGRVSQARIKFHSRYANHYFYYHLYEFDFWKIAEKPSVLTLSTEPADVGLTQAKVRGKLIDLGGASQVEIWFVWNKNYHDNWQDYAYSNAAAKETRTQTGEFEYTITSLLSTTTYHFRAVGSNAAGTSSSEDKTFTTLGECITGATTTCTSLEGCDHIIECPPEGYWPPCPRDECVKNATSTPDCPCPSPPPGYVSPDYGDCTDSCTCNVSTGLGEPCELWLSNQPPDKPGIPDVYQPSGESWNHCRIRGISVPTFHWTYSDPDGDPQEAYEIRIDNDSDFSVIDADEFKCNGQICSGGASTAFTPIPPDWANWMNWNTAYWWIVRVKDDQNNWSIWSDPNPFTTPLHAYPWPDFSWSPVRPSQEEVVVFDSSQTQIYGGTTISQYFWTITEGLGEFVDGTDNSSANPHIKFSTQTNKIKLKVTDSDGYSCDCPEKTLTTTLPLPEWMEIPPF